MLPVSRFVFQIFISVGDILFWEDNEVTGGLFQLALAAAFLSSCISWIHISLGLWAFCATRYSGAPLVLCWVQCRHPNHNRRTIFWLGSKSILLHMFGLVLQHVRVPPFWFLCLSTPYLVSRIAHAQHLCGPRPAFFFRLNTAPWPAVQPPTPNPLKHVLWAVLA